MAEYEAQRPIWKDGHPHFAVGARVKDGDLPAIAIQQLLANRGLRAVNAEETPRSGPTLVVTGELAGDGESAAESAEKKE